jgi:hypothetical protein
MGINIKINIRYCFSSDDSELTKEELLDNAKYIWSHSYDTPDNGSNDKSQLPYFKGKLYDFYPGMKITVELNFIESSDNCITINYYENNTDRSYTYSVTSDNTPIDSKTIINVYKKPERKTNPYEKAFHTFSHELGHAFGLADAYADEKVNRGFQIYTDYNDPNLEIPSFSLNYIGSYDSGEIMGSNGLPCSNDIEMILQRFSENKKQFFVNSSNIYENELLLSKAIKNPILIYEKTLYDGTGRTKYLIHFRKNNSFVETYYKEVLGNYVDITK